MADKVEHLQRELPSTDRAKLHEYLDAVREVERRIQIARSAVLESYRLWSRPKGYRSRTRSTRS